MSGLAGRFDAVSYESCENLSVQAVEKTLVADTTTKRAKIVRSFGQAIACASSLPYHIFEGSQYTLLAVGRMALHTIEGPKTRPDLLRMLHEQFYYQGPSALKEICGQFQLIIVSHHRPEIYLFNDKHGAFPIYYTQNDGELFFSFDLKKLVESQPGKIAPSVEGKLSYLAFGATLPPYTPFERVFELPAGCMLKYIEGEVSTIPYAPFEFIDANPATLHSLPNALKHLLHQRLPYYRQEKSCAVLQQPFLSNHFLKFFIGRQQEESVFINAEDSEKENAAQYSHLPCNHQDGLRMLRALKTTHIPHMMPLISSVGGELLFAENSLFTPVREEAHSYNRLSKLKQNVKTWYQYLKESAPKEMPLDPIHVALEMAYSFFEDEKRAALAKKRVRNRLEECMFQSKAKSLSDRQWMSNYVLNIQPMVRTLFRAGLDMGYEIAFPYLDDGIFSLNLLRFSSQSESKEALLRAELKRLLHLSVDKHTQTTFPDITHNAITLSAWLERFRKYFPIEEPLEYSVL